MSEVKSKVDIVGILSEYIDLKKSGRNFKALCPFHSEKTPSFMVSQELQIYKCFGCGEGGDVFDFLQKYEGMDFYESLKHLAEKTGIKLKPLSPDQKGEKEKYYEINALANKFYHYLLTNHSVGKYALSYLLKERKLKLETIKTFGLGYSPDNPFALKKYLCDKKKLAVEDLVKAGLVFMKDGGVFDRFRGRVVFPLYDHRGNILAFAGRILPNEKNRDLAKYINSPETPVYHKSNVLFGLNVVKSDIKKRGFVVIVEGELDMISSWQAGVKNVVAIKGSSLTQEQVKLLSRYTQSVVLALDADAAGDTAARRGIQIAEREGLELKVAELGKYKDPDDLARNEPEKLDFYINNAVGIWDFLINSAFTRYGSETGIQKAKLSKELVPLLSSISDNILRSHYAQEVARRLGVSIDAVSEQIGKFVSQGVSHKPNIEESLIKKESKSIRGLTEERLLAVAFRFNPETLLEKETVKLVNTPLAKNILISFSEFMKKNKEFDPSFFAGELPKELVDGFAGMILKEIGGLDDKPERYDEEIKIIKKNLMILNVKEKIETVSQELKKAESLGDKKGLRKGQEEFNKLSLLLKNIEEK